MMAGLEASASPDNPEAVKNMMIQRIPMKRYGKNEEIAHGILYLVSADSTYVAGINLEIDGGISNSLM
jgi:NAD(P)-dependent dehydrogenase (short-subunit alcohol dehydrogenase family)